MKVRNKTYESTNIKLDVGHNRTIYTSNRKKAYDLMPVREMETNEMLLTVSVRYFTENGKPPIKRHLGFVRTIKRSISYETERM